MAQWSAMSLAAQSLAAQGLETARAAVWEPRWWTAVTNTGPGTYDELPPTNYMEPPAMLDIPISGTPYSTNAGQAFTNYAFFATNFVTVSLVSSNPYVRQIRVDCVWVFPPTRQPYTNTIVTQRAADEL
jgi:hypothetical protein